MMKIDQNETKSFLNIKYLHLISDFSLGLSNMKSYTLGMEESIPITNKVHVNIITLYHHANIITPCQHYITIHIEFVGDHYTWSGAILLTW